MDIYEQLSKELNEFLSEYSIYGFGIFRDWILHKSGVNPELGKQCHFSFDPYWGKNVNFKIIGLNEEESQKILAILETTNSSPNKKGIPLSNNLLLEHLLPQFKADFASFVLDQPETLKDYQRKSRDSLDSYFLQEASILSKDIKKKLKELVAEPYQEEIECLKKQLYIFEKASSAYNSAYDAESNFQEIYKTILTSKKYIEEWIQANNSCIAKFELEPELLKLNQFLNHFIKANRSEAYQKVRNFFHNEIESFLAQFEISIRKCDIFEHILLRMAGIHDLSGIYEFNMDNQERSRIWIDLHYREEQDNLAALMLHFFQSQGDETAYIKFKDKLKFKDAFDDEGEDLGYFIYENGMRIQYPKRCLVPSPNLPTSYRFSLDGEFVAETLLPQFKKYVTDLAAAEPEFLIPYQKKSEKYLKELRKQETKLAQTSSSFFFYQEKGSSDEEKGLPPPSPGQFLPSKGL